MTNEQRVLQKLLARTRNAACIVDHVQETMADEVVKITLLPHPTAASKGSKAETQLWLQPSVSWLPFPQFGKRQNSSFRSLTEKKLTISHKLSHC